LFYEALIAFLRDIFHATGTTIVLEEAELKDQVQKGMLLSQTRRMDGLDISSNEKHVGYEEETCRFTKVT